MKFDIKFVRKQGHSMFPIVGQVEAASQDEAQEAAWAELNKQGYLNASEFRLEVKPLAEADRALIAQCWAEVTGNKADQLVMSETQWDMHLAILRRLRGAVTP